MDELMSVGSDGVGAVNDGGVYILVRREVAA